MTVDASDSDGLTPEEVARAERALRQVLDDVTDHVCWAQRGVWICELHNMTIDHNLNPIMQVAVLRAACRILVWEDHATSETVIQYT